MYQRALDTVVQAQGLVASTGGLRGVKRKGLAADLTSPKSGRHHLAWASSYSPPLPPALLAMCKPLHCDLCSSQATSPVQAKMHYEGKGHAKAVRGYFASLNSLNPLNSAVPVPQKVGSGPSPLASSLHCSTCDLAFTSLQQMEQHQAGKQHTRKAGGLPTLRPGYYNKEEHRWEKVPPEEASTSSPSTSSSGPDNHAFYCTLCKVGAPSQEQMAMHLQGKAHRGKMAKHMGGVENGDLEEIARRCRLKEGILAAVSTPTSSKLPMKTPTVPSKPPTVSSKPPTVSSKPSTIFPSQPSSSRAFTGLTKVLGMDCEMVGVGREGTDSILARVSIVNHFGHCVYDKFVAPREKVTDYRTAVSGVRPQDLAGAPQFAEVQAEVAEILKGRVIVGHSISHDFKVLFLDHPKKLIRDTSKYKPFKAAFGNRTPSLKNLTARFLGVKVQEGEHSSVQDSQAAVRLYTMHRKEWEAAREARRKASPRNRRQTGKDKTKKKDKTEEKFVSKVEVPVVEGGSRRAMYCPSDSE